MDLKIIIQDQRKEIPNLFINIGPECEHLHLLHGGDHKEVILQKFLVPFLWARYSQINTIVYTPQEQLKLKILLFYHGLWDLGGAWCLGGCYLDDTRPILWCSGTTRIWRGTSRWSVSKHLTEFPVRCIKT